MDRQQIDTLVKEMNVEHRYTPCRSACAAEYVVRLVADLFQAIEDLRRSAFRSVERSGIYYRCRQSQ